MKMVNFVLGLGTAIILAALITLGIKAFYPEPKYPDYPIKPSPAYTLPCKTGDTACLQQWEEYNQVQAQYNEEQQVYQDQIAIYNRNVFIVANIVGIIVFAIGFWMLFATAVVAQSVPIGIMVAGLWSIIYGYGRGWGSVNDQLKFFIGLVIAVLVIGGSMWLIQRYAQKRGNA
jgi:hypothetical protein